MTGEWAPLGRVADEYLYCTCMLSTSVNEWEGVCV